MNPCVHYKRKDSLRCLTAKRNSTGIRFSLDEGNKIGTVKWQGLVFSIDLSKCTLYEWQALQSDICYCAVKREKIKGKWKYYIQITLKGHVPDKFDKQTGELKRQLGKGNVGLYFTSTSLTVSTENGVKTYPLEIKNHEDKKTELLQKMDASRRATNPDNYNEDGTSKEKSEIKEWHFSKAYKNIVLNFTKFTARNARKRNCCRKSLQMKSLHLVMCLIVIKWTLNFFKEIWAKRFSLPVQLC